MKTMFMIDLTSIRVYLLQTCGICIAVALFMGFAMNTLASVGACIAAMVPLLCTFSLLSYDEMNNWQSLRLAMPLTRNDVVNGRYLVVGTTALASAIAALAISFLVAVIAGALGPSSPVAGLSLEANPPDYIIGSVLFALSVSLVVAAGLLPPAMKLGMTRGVRYAPFIIMIVFLAGATLFGEGGPLQTSIPAMLEFFGSSSAAVVAAGVAMCAIALVLFAISLAVARKLYATRAF